MLPSAAGAAGANDLRSDVDVRLRFDGEMQDPMLDSRATLLDMLRECAPVKPSYHRILRPSKLGKKHQDSP
jgi:hypothetical protein